ncbi:MAG TPA: hypothetical protein VLG93_05415 [Sulfuricaulis sp.]|nr:hypothetical protein [Sulfuricaulis sp.]
MNARAFHPLALAMFACTNLAATPGAVAQVNTWGYVEYSARREQSEDLTDTEASFTTLRLNASTYFWEPWIAQFTGGLGLTFSDTRQDGASQDGTEVTGEARMQLFPRSHFPLEAFVERRDSRIDGEIAGPDFTSTTYGISQSYTPAVGARIGFQARHTDRHEERDLPFPLQLDSTDDYVTLGINRAFDAHSLDFRTDLNQATREQPRQENTRHLHMLRHRYGKAAAFTLENMLSYTDDRTRENTLESLTTQTQLNSTAFWRPNTEKPLLATGSALVSAFETNTNGSSSQLDFAVVNGGVSYQWSPALNLQASATASQRDSGQDQASTTLAKGVATYAPDPLNLGDYAYRWSLTGELANRTGEEGVPGSVQEYAASFGHGLSRTRPLGDGTFGTSVNQQYAALRDSVDRSEQTLTHTVALDWSAYGDNTATFVRLSGSDTRRHAEEDTGFRLFNLQVSRTRQIDRLSSLGGNVTLQRAETVNGAGQDAEITTTSAELSYRHMRAFGVPRLVFTSELRVVSDDVGDTLRADAINAERRDRSWTNRLDYTVGRLELSSRVMWSQFDGRDYHLVYFQARRHFGGLR